MRNEIETPSCNVMITKRTLLLKTSYPKAFSMQLPTLFYWRRTRMNKHEKCLRTLWLTFYRHLAVIVLQAGTPLADSTSNTQRQRYANSFRVNMAKQLSVCCYAPVWVPYFLAGHVERSSRISAWNPKARGKFTPQTVLAEACEHVGSAALQRFAT